MGYVCFDICGGIKRVSSDGHRARMYLPQKLCPFCDKQVIPSVPGQLRINFTRIFKVSPELPASRSDSGNFEKPLKIRVKLILNCSRAHAITCTKLRLTLLTQLTTGLLIGQRFTAYCMGKLRHIITGNHASYDPWLKFDHTIRTCFL